MKWCVRTLFITLRVDDVSGQDADGSGALDFNEFVSLIEHLKKVSHAMAQKKLHAKHKHEHNAHSEDPEMDALFHTIDMDDRHARTSFGLVDSFVVLSVSGVVSIGELRNNRVELLSKLGLDGQTLSMAKLNKM